MAGFDDVLGKIIKGATPVVKGASRAKKRAAELAAGNASGAAKPAYPRVNTRQPTKGPDASAPMGSLVADTQAYLRTPSAAPNMQMMTETYPGMSRLFSDDPTQTSENIIEHMKGNVLSLYDLANTKGITAESAKWYDGANRIATEMGQRFGLPTEKMAGVLAVLSPQKDWYQNVALGERLVKAMSEVTPSSTWTPQMDNVALTGSMDKEGMTAFTRNADFANVRGRPYGEMQTPEQKAMWLRAYDEATSGRDYREIAPTGDILGYMTNTDGSRSKFIPATFRDMAKAISIIEGPGTLESISPLLGSEHKVRNFFNNILSPQSPLDLTADTHQIAAGIMMPYGGSAPEVLHGLSGAGSPKAGMPWSNIGGQETGTTSAYGLHFDATKRAAEEQGWLPREMQSITWEQLRALMPSWMRGNHPFVKTARDIWGMVDAGDMTADQARAAIVSEAQKLSGSATPSWATYNGPRRSMLGGGAGLLGLIGATGLATAKEVPQQPPQGLLDDRMYGGGR